MVRALTLFHLLGNLYMVVEKYEIKYALLLNSTFLDANKKTGPLAQST